MNDVCVLVTLKITLVTIHYEINMANEVIRHYCADYRTDYGRYP